MAARKHSITSKRGERIAEIFKLLEVTDEIGLAIVLDKARDISKERPRDKMSAEVIRMPMKGCGDETETNQKR